MSFPRLKNRDSNVGETLIPDILGSLKLIYQRWDPREENSTP